MDVLVESSKVLVPPIIVIIIFYKVILYSYKVLLKICSKSQAKDISQSRPHQHSSAFTIDNLLRDLPVSNPTPEVPPAPVIFPSSPYHSAGSSSSSSSFTSTNSLSPSSPWRQLQSPSGIPTPSFPLPFVPIPLNNLFPYPSLGNPTYSYDSQPAINIGTMGNSVNNGAPLINSWAPAYLGQTKEAGGFKNQRRNQGTLFRNKACNCSNAIEVIDISEDDVEPNTLSKFGTHKQGPTCLGVEGNLNQFALPISPESVVMDVDFPAETHVMADEDVEVTLIDCIRMTSEGTPEVVPNGTTEAGKGVTQCMTLEEDAGNSNVPVTRGARRDRRRSRMDPDMPKLIKESDYRLRLRSSRMPSLVPAINAMEEPDK